jgi:hypothetical protein
MTLSDQWSNHAWETAQRPPEICDVVKPFLALASYVIDSRWSGACHAVAAVLHILFQEVGVSSTLCLGEAQLGRIAFDHSWVEANGSVFDVAIIGTLDQRLGAPPTFRSVDLDTLREPRVLYGITTGEGRHSDATALLATPFHRFMSRYPDAPEGLWGIARLVGLRAGLTLSVRALKDRYGRTEWSLR